ncbi:CheR family methyltransferase [Roseobacteraceae bacterium S113]
MLSSTSRGEKQPQNPTLITDRAFQRISNFIRADSGIMLDESKRSLTISRLSKRLRTLGMDDFDAYCDLLEANPASDERREMLFALTTNVTRFFREQHHFEQLSDEMLPPLLERARAGGRVRIWSAGCSSGEEPYSIAMNLLSMCPNAPDLDIRILATDIDAKVIAQGKLAKYKDSEADKIPRSMLANFCKRENGQVDMNQDVRKLVQFAELNLLSNWPMNGRFDIIFCRNVVIYFDIQTQERLWCRFSEILNPGGFLVVGHSERISGSALSNLTMKPTTRYQKS